MRLRLSGVDGAEPPSGSDTDVIGPAQTAHLHIGGNVLQITLTAELRIVPNIGMNTRKPAHGSGALRLASDADTKPIPGKQLKPLLGLLPAWERDMRVRLEKAPAEVVKAVAAAREFIAHSGARTAADINAKAAIGWLTQRIESGGEGAKKTAKNLLSRLRGFAAFLKLEDQLTEDPLSMVRLPSAPRRKGADPFNIDEVERLADAAEQREEKHWQARKNGPLASTLYRFMTHTGLRFNECRFQMWADIDTDRGTLIVTRDKARRADAIPLSRHACDLLRAWRFFSRGDRLFPLMPSHHTLDEDMKKAGIPKQDAGRKGQWHRFRKCAIRERARRGAPIRELHKLARHATLEMTTQHYDIAEVDELRAVAELMPDLKKTLEHRLDKADSVGQTDSGCNVTKRSIGQESKTEPSRPKGTAPQPESVQPHDRKVGSVRSPSRGSDPVGLEPAGDEWSRGELNPRHHPPPATAQLIDRITQAHKSYLELCLRVAGELERGCTEPQS